MAHAGGRPPKPEDERAVQMTISFTRQQMDELIAYCQRNDRNISWCIRKALTPWLAKHRDDVEGE